MQMENKTPILYIFMREDMKSLTPGKACAQAAHAASMLAEDPGIKKGEGRKLYEEWLGDRNFGTVIVVSISGSIEVKVFDGLRDKLGIFASGAVVDPSYPLKDGEITHIIPDVFTCGWAFGIKEELGIYDNFYPLYDYRF